MESKPLSKSLVWGPYGPLEALGIPMALNRALGGTLILGALKGFKESPTLAR